MSEVSREEDCNIEKYLLSLSAILNAMILETGITHTPEVYWCLCVSVPLLALTMYKAKTGPSIGRDSSL